MKTTVKPAGSQFKKKVLARWRWLARQGTSLEQPAFPLWAAEFLRTIPPLGGRVSHRHSPSGRFPD